MYRLPCTIEYIHDEVSPAYILTLSRADLPRLTDLVGKIKDGSSKGVELAGKDGKVCRVGREGGLLVFVIGDLTLRLDEDQDGCFVSFLADMTADAPRYDHIDLEFRDAGIDVAVRVKG
ncbi:MAG: hypothetical protein IJD38_06425 [Clostridia bacterium]|nr:hypothetical protein [Clostridia bacterium]